MTARTKGNLCLLAWFLPMCILVWWATAKVMPRARWFLILCVVLAIWDAGMDYGREKGFIPPPKQRKPVEWY